MTWQPISTAPTDGATVDIWSPAYGRLCNYTRIHYSLNNVFYDPVAGGVCCVRDATHWMQIPDAPIDREARQAFIDGEQPCPACKRLVAELARAVEAWGWCANRI